MRPSLPNDGRRAVAVGATLGLVLSGCAASRSESGSWPARTRGAPAAATTSAPPQAGPSPVFGPGPPASKGKVPGGLTATELGAFTPSEGRLLSCSDDAKGVPDRAVVYCPADCLGRHGIWGSRIYTSDSCVCGAAIHDGVLDERGGYVLVMKRPGQSAYAGSTAHGVTSSSYGEYDESFEVFGVSGVETFPFKLACHQDAKTVLTRYPPRAVLSCPSRCPRSQVYGDGYYTVDSSVCGAAQHAGVPPASFVIRAAGRRDSFGGRWSHGIRSSPWSSAWDAFTTHPWSPAAP